MVKNNIKHNRRHSKNTMIKTFNTCTFKKKYLKKMIKKAYTTAKIHVAMKKEIIFFSLHFIWLHV
jgi:hypothetical protein